MVKSILCDNGVKAHLGQPIFSGGCYRGKATVQVTIGYVNAIGDVFDKDTLNLCDQCLKLAKKAARRHGYKISVKPLFSLVNYIERQHGNLNQTI